MKHKDHSTEEKIKAAARELFHQKGYEGTKTRDIAEAAGINVALMNYYFRSKKKLFDLIMMETIETFFQSVVTILRDEKSTPPEKIQQLVHHYTAILLDEPDLPIFILSEMRSNPSLILDNIVRGNHVQDTQFIQLIRHHLNHNIDDPENLGHILLNLISMIIFPFAAKPIIMELLNFDEDGFRSMMKARENLLLVWMSKLLPPDSFTQFQSDV